jgi:hypothetical protein
VIRTDGVIPSIDEMYWLFKGQVLENLEVKVPLPGHHPYVGSVVVFRNIGDYNDVRNFMQRNGNIVHRIFRLIAK